MVAGDGAPVRLLPSRFRLGETFRPSPGDVACTRVEVSLELDATSAARDAGEVGLLKDVVMNCLEDNAESVGSAIVGIKGE